MRTIVGAVVRAFVFGAVCVAVATPARADEAACRHAVAKASRKFVAVALKSAQRCVAKRGKACRPLADSTGYAPADSALKHARTQLDRGLRDCSDDAVAGMGFSATCRDAVGTRAALGGCLERTHRAAVQAIVSVQFPQGTDTCGDGVIDDVEECDPVAVPTGCDVGETCGSAGTDDECLCVTGNSPQCGDGTVESNEQCDPAASPSGCNVGFTCVAAGQAGECTCSNGNGSSCGGECSPTCAGGQPCVCTCGGVCGNGTTDPGEQCDPMANPSGCGPGLICGAPGTAQQCTCFGGAGQCGNGQLDPGEGCDPALPNNCDPGEVCLADGAMACTCGAPPANCGNGLVEWGEQCDPSATPTGCGAGQTCGARGTPGACTCTGGGSPMCGNGVQDPGEACDPTAAASGCVVGETCSQDCRCVAAASCGNGTIDAGEACDPAANPTGCPSGATCDASTCTCSTSSGNCAISPQPTRGTFTTADGSGACGQASAGGAGVLDLTCGSLYFGGGLNTTVPPAPAPGGAPSVFDVTGCDGSVLTLSASAGSGQKDCTRSGCDFGPPLPIRNGPLSTCVVNTLSANASGTVDVAAGTAMIHMALSSGVFLTQDDTAPCPICSGTCQAGPRAGMPCTPLGTAHTSPDCPPGDAPLSSLAVDLTPLTTGSTSKTGPDYCPSQTHHGAFGKPTADKITETGHPASGGITAGSPATITLGSTFCIPKTGNGALDPTADLPGPGAISLPGTLMIQ